MARTQTVEEFYERLLRKLGEMAMREVRPQIPSTTLQEALVLEVGTDLLEPRAVLYIPHHWALYVHDGRGPVTPVEKVWLVWFQNPADDPRTDGGRNYPVRVADARRLTQADWQRGLDENAKRRRAGQEPYMVVTKHSGPVTYPKSFEFFEKGLSTFSSRAGPVVREEFDAYVRSLTKPRTDTAKLTLRV